MTQSEVSITETKYINFSINGEFVTKLAREKFEIDKDLAYALRLLTGMLNNDQMSPDEIAGKALRILTGQAEIVGTYPGEDYGYVETDSSPINFDKFNIVQQLKQTIDEQAQELDNLRNKLKFIENNDAYYMRVSDIARQYYNDTGEHLFDPDSPVEISLDRNKALESVIEATKYNDNYGWLDPKGNFYPVPWSDHTEWAAQYLTEHYDVTPDDEEYMQPVDALVRKGWVLLHNPTKGLPRITNLGNNLTKQQRDFLYGFFIDRNMTKEANDVMSESEYNIQSEKYM